MGDPFDPRKLVRPHAGNRRLRRRSDELPRSARTPSTCAFSQRGADVAVDDLAAKIYSPDQLHEMLPECDFVAITAPLTPQTRKMIGAKEIALMKSTAVLINVGRGPIVDQAALVQALQNKKIRGAALDVFEVEPLCPSVIRCGQLDNVYVSPHNADRTYTKRDSATEFFIENFNRFRDGQPLLNIVDKHAGY